MSSPIDALIHLLRVALVDDYWFRRVFNLVSFGRLRPTNLMSLFDFGNSSVQGTQIIWYEHMHNHIDTRVFLIGGLGVGKGQRPESNVDTPWTKHISMPQSEREAIYNERLSVVSLSLYTPSFVNLYPHRQHHSLLCALDMLDTMCLPVFVFFLKHHSALVVIYFSNRCIVVNI